MLIGLMLKNLKYPYLSGLILILLPIVILLFIASSQGSSPGPWKSNIKYYDGTGQSWAVQKATSVWNGIGLPVRFVPTNDEASADLLITNANKKYIHQHCHSNCIGWTNHIGYDPDIQSHVYLDPEVSVNNFYRLALHELGHVLGLQHNTQECALMTPSATCWSLTTGLMQPRCSLQSDSQDALAIMYKTPVKNFSCPSISYQYYSYLLYLRLSQEQ